ncbi:MAG: fibronectin-binding autotransporter adhesin [Solirubrobacteraceae bacterium]|nr:fibronectin-binding autotransporter adhesin [Solirubrobacteraceae bacterium]
MRGLIRPSRLLTYAIAVAAALAVAVATAHGAPLPACTDHWAGATGGGAWETPANWDHGVPGSGSVACWDPGTVVTVSTGTQVADSVQGGELTVSAGSLTLGGAHDSSLSGLTITGGDFSGPSGQTLTLAGPFHWSGGQLNTGGGGLAIAQSGTHAFAIDGTNQAYMQGGSLSTGNPIAISNTSFITTNGPTLTTTSTLDLAPGEYSQNGGWLAPITAAGIVTTGDATVRNWSLHVTGNASSLGGDLGLPALAVDQGKSITVPAGDDLSVASGTLSGTVGGAGRYVQDAGTVTVPSGGQLSTADVSVPSGTLDVAPGSTYSASHATSVGSNGTLELGRSASTGDYSQTGGSLTGTGPLAVGGAFSWTAGQIGSSGSTAVNQTGGGAFSITGSSQAYLIGGQIHTTSPATITNLHFINTGGAALSTTKALTLGPGVYDANGGTSMPLSADGIVTTGDTTVKNWTTDLTGNSSSLGGNLTLPALNTDSGTTLTVPGGDALTVAAGSIAGTITGAGTYAQDAGTTSIVSGGELSTGDVSVPTGTLAVNAGSTYSVNHTTVGGGTLHLTHGSATGDYTETGGQLDGAGPLSVSGAFSWSQGQIDSTAVNQTGGGAFSITGTQQAYLIGGRLGTTSPVSITNPAFITASAATLTTSQAITLADGLSIPVNGGNNATFTAGGIGPNAGPSYGFGADSLVLTGGSTTVATGHALRSGTLTLQAGTLQDDGTIDDPLLTGGLLKGTGTVTRALDNEGGTVAPGDSPGTLTVDGDYTQGANGTLAVVANGTGAGQASQLAVQGATLAGTLAMQPSNAYASAAAVGDRIHVLRYTGTLTGAFDSVTSTPALAGGRSFAAQDDAANGLVDAVVSPPPAPGAGGTAPVIDGETVEGKTLHTSDGTWTNSPDSFAYQWQRCDAGGASCTDVAGATANTYTLTAADVGHTMRAVVTATNAGGHSAQTSAPSAKVTAKPQPAPAPTPTPSPTPTPAPTPAPAPAAVPLPLSCSGRPIVLLDVRTKGAKVLVAGLALPKYAGQKVTLTSVPKGQKVGSAVVQSDGTFQGLMPAPARKQLAKIRYVATIAGQHSLALRLTRKLVITGESASARSVVVRMRLAKGKKGQALTVTRQDSCTHQTLFKKVKLGKGGTFAVTLPRPAGKDAVAFYRAAGAGTASLPITVRAAG